MDQTNDVAEVAVLGVGRMGRHHARTYARLPQARLVGVVDFDEDRVETVADEYGCTGYTRVESLLAAHPSLKAVTVAVPTEHHADAARPLLERGIACLIEKPIAGSVAEAQELADFARRHHAVLQVGHTERFNPAVRAVAKMDITPRFIEITRVSPMTFRSMDVGVVMDMMIHDLDVVLSLVNRPIKKIDAVGISVLGAHEDICDARLTFEGGCVCTFTVSRVALKTERRLRLFSEDAYVSLDYGNRSGIVVRMTANEQSLDEVREKLRGGQDLSDLNYMDLVAMEELTMDLPPGQEDPLTAQATAFLHAAITGGAPVVTAEHGYAAVAAAERIVETVRAHQWEGLERKAFEGHA
ncbi:MAG: Gfo/Idh/MocA family oxidoreductase [Planctomycetota bacterium]